MIRQPFSNATKAYKTHTTVKGAVIKASDYDLGRNGFAYYDQDTANYRVSGKPGAGNKGSTYRNDGVDIYKEDQSEDVYVGSIETGEWLQYTIRVKRNRQATIALWLSTAKPGGKVMLSDADKTFAVSVDVPVTGAETNWQPVLLKNIKLKKGVQKLVITCVNGGYNFKEIRFE